MGKFGKFWGDLGVDLGVDFEGDFEGDSERLFSLVLKIFIFVFRYQ